ncbi:MMPL family transporter [Peribacillus cavernae]|uniref:MMPL family transporter n=1 Tax=Peribacillus cavernae TaxID=1674310 RepID=A0A3S0TZX6_9BACI|nr:MMPL family transporter [Peribacillus cavernae]MDQ0217816.1 RND superfamily putative drug exporter [Peribacillus cavernae]RUQ28264.1 MMPL family transporter [Peribacillus cavernae]
MTFFSNGVMRFYKFFLIVWSIAAIGLGVFAIQLPSILGGDGFEVDGEYNRVEKELNKTFHIPESTIQVTFEKRTGENSQSFNNRINNTLADIESLHVTAGIQSPLKDKSLRTNDFAYAVLSFDSGVDNMESEMKAIRRITDRDQQVKLTGIPVVSQDINKASQDDLKRAELIGIPVAIVILLLAFGSVAASIVPIAVGAVTVIASFGILSLIGDRMDLSIFLLNIVPMIGLALSIDFSLLFINRYREELKRSGQAEAIHTTILTAGRSILFSALCVFIGLAAMLVIKVEIFQTVAIGGMVVVGIAVFSSLTLLPSLLMIMGKNINRWRIIKTKDTNGSGWREFAFAVMKHPVLISSVSFVVLLLAIIPVKDMNLVIPKADSLPDSYESRQAHEQIQKTFNNKNESIVYVIAERPGSWLDEEGLREMNHLTATLQKDKIVQSIETIYSLAGMDSPEKLAAALKNPKTKETLQPAIERYIQGDKLLLPVTLSARDTSDVSQSWIRKWTEKEWDYRLSFGGSTKFNQEIFDEIYDKIPLVLAIILISTFIILTLAFRSLVIPLKAILMNIVSLSAAFGVLVWIFQYGHFGLEETDITLIIPVLVFSLVFGLSMDYEVFLISRIQEIYLESGNNDLATAEGLASTSKIITSAALIMIVITGAFAFTGVMPVKQIGVGIAIAIFIDATIIRLLLVPSLMKLLGDWNWWLPFAGKNRMSSRSRKVNKG